jgi:hypothetical protein
MSTAVQQQASDNSTEEIPFAVPVTDTEGREEVEKVEDGEDEDEEGVHKVGECGIIHMNQLSTSTNNTFSSGSLIDTICGIRHPMGPMDRSLVRKQHKVKPQDCPKDDSILKALMRDRKGVIPIAWFQGLCQDELFWLHYSDDYADKNRIAYFYTQYNGDHYYKEIAPKGVNKADKVTRDGFYWTNGRSPDGRMIEDILKSIRQNRAIPIVMTESGRPDFYCMICGQSRRFRNVKTTEDLIFMCPWCAQKCPEKTRSMRGRDLAHNGREIIYIDPYMHPGHPQYANRTKRHIDHTFHSGDRY